MLIQKDYRSFCQAAGRRADDARGPRLAAIEDFSMNPFRRHIQTGERLFHVCHEARRPADVNICLLRDADLVEDRSRQVTDRVEILADLIA